MPPIEDDTYALCPNCSLVLRTEPEGRIVYCVRCGAQMLAECPHCEEPIRFAFAVYCTACGRKYVEKEPGSPGSSGS